VKSAGKITLVLGAVLLVAGGYGYAHRFELMHLMMHNGMGGMGAMMGHDEVNMPGLKGANATPEESAELAVMFNNFKTFTRNVTNLPNGIRTVTTSSNPEVMAALTAHVSGMIGRVEALDDPKIIIQSPTLDIFFQRGKGITSTIDITDEGIVVVQTSDDPEMVTALQTHAGEVSDMAARGMQAVHEMMAKRMGG
jgi:hypothetical protein